MNGEQGTLDVAGGNARGGDSGASRYLGERNIVPFVRELSETRPEIDCSSCGDEISSWIEVVVEIMLIVAGVVGIIAGVIGA